MSNSVAKVGKQAIKYMGGRKVFQPPKAAIDLIKKQPTIMVKDRSVHCDGGHLRLGHPRVYINLDHGVHTCGYCGQTFKQDTSQHEH